MYLNAMYLNAMYLNAMYLNTMYLNTIYCVPSGGHMRARGHWAWCWAQGTGDLDELKVRITAEDLDEVQPEIMACLGGVSVERGAQEMRGTTASPEYAVDEACPATYVDEACLPPLSTVPCMCCACAVHVPSGGKADGCRI